MNFMKKIKYLVLLGYGLLCNVAYAMNSNMPTEVKGKTDDMESIIVWSVTIGGVIAIGACFWAIHKNKGQGGWVETVAYGLIGLALFIVVIAWWATKAKTATSGFVF